MAIVPIGTKTSEINSNKTIRYVIGSASGIFFISSIACFFVGSFDLKEDGILIKEGKNKKYKITSDGNTIKFNF